MTRNFDGESRDSIDEQLDQLIAEAARLVAEAEQTKKASKQQSQKYPGKEPLCRILNDKALRRRLFERVIQAKPKERAKLKNDFIWVMQQSEIWKDPKDDEEVYQEASQRTWKWFSQVFDQYDPEESNPVTWFEKHLKYRILDVYKEDKRERELREKQKGEAETYPSERQNLLPEEYARAMELLEKIHAWIEKNKKELQRIHVSEHSEANCYELILKRLLIWDEQTQQFLDGKTWEQIIQELDVLAGEDQRQLLRKVQRCYRERCLCRLRDFLQS